MTRYEALLACRDAAGSDSALSRDLGVTQPMVWRWVNQSKQLPPEHVLRAESLYGVSRHELRPDIYPRNYPLAPDAPDRFYGVDQIAIRDTPENRGHYFSRRPRTASNGKAT